MDHIKHLSKKELAEIWNTLNKWNWDNRLGEKPENWDSMPDFAFTENHKNPTKRDFISPYTRYIEKQIGEKECLRWHHINNLGSNNLKFEVWWLKNSICKFLRIGFYSKKTQRAIANILENIMQKNKEDWIRENYSNQR